MLPASRLTAILDLYRKSDLVLLVSQDNKTRTLTIEAVNAIAAAELGYSQDELIGMPFTSILPKRLVTILDEYLNYEDEEEDLLAVFGKVSNFAVKTRDNCEMYYRLRIIRGESLSKNPWFHLVLVDEKLDQQVKAFRSILQENFKGHEVLDPRTGMPDRASLLKDIELVLYYIRSKDMSAVFTLVDINQYEQIQATHGQEMCDKLHTHIGQICKQKLRPDDTVGSISERTIGIILLESSQESARMVLNRLRWAISVSPLVLSNGKELAVQVNMHFSPMDGRASEEEIVKKCESFMESARLENVSNATLLVLTHDRRMSEHLERSRTEIPVAFERRKENRHDDDE